MTLKEWTRSGKLANDLIEQIDLKQLATASQDDLVSLGFQLWWVSERANAATEVIKDQLRKIAGHLKSQRFKTEDAFCIVLPQSPTIEVKKDADIKALKKALGTEFGDYFEEIVTYKPRKDFRERVPKADPGVAQTIMGAVTMTPRASRVTFRE